MTRDPEWIEYVDDIDVIRGLASTELCMDRRASDWVFLCRPL